MKNHLHRLRPINLGRTLLAALFCLACQVQAQDSATVTPARKSSYYLHLGIGTVSMGETVPQPYPMPYTMADYLKIYEPSLALLVGKNYRRFSWEAGLELFYLRGFDQWRISSLNEQIYFYNYDERVVLLTAPVLAKWTFGQKKWRFELESGAQLFFLQHRIEKGEVNISQQNQPPNRNFEPYYSRNSSFFAVPTPRLGTGMSYSSQGQKKYGVQLGVMGVPGFFVLTYAKVLFYFPPPNLKNRNSIGE